MNEDEYLSTLVMLYESGHWDEETVRKQALLYAKERGYDKSLIDEFLNRLFPKKDITIDDKREVLKNAKFSTGELMYPSVVDKMTDEQVEKLYEIETKSAVKEKEEEKEKFEEKANEKLVPDESEKKESNVIKVPVKIVEVKEETNEGEEVVEAPKNVKPIPIKTEPEEKKDDLPIIDFSAFLEKELEKEKNTEEKEEKVEEEKEDEFIDFARLAEETNAFFEGGSEPSTEEEFTDVHDNITNKEKDSSVRVVEISPERQAKLKKKKQKVINYFLKGAIIVSALLLLHPVESLPLIGGYLYFASKIKDGTFMPKTKIGEGVKSVVTSIMNIGIKKEDEILEEGGRTK